MDLGYNATPWRPTWCPIADEHGVILPIIVVDLVLLERGREDLPCGVVEADLEALEVVLTVLALWTSRYGIGL